MINLGDARVQGSVRRDGKEEKGEKSLSSDPPASSFFSFLIIPSAPYGGGGGGRWGEGDGEAQRRRYRGAVGSSGLVAGLSPGSSCSKGG